MGHDTLIIKYDSIMIAICLEHFTIPFQIQDGNRLRTKKYKKTHSSIHLYIIYIFHRFLKHLKPSTNQPTSSVLCLGLVSQPLLDLCCKIQKGPFQLGVETLPVKSRSSHDPAITNTILGAGEAQTGKPGNSTRKA